MELINFLDTNPTIEQLVEAIDYLIEKDFNKLLLILYRIDINEEKLKQALKSTEKPAAEIIAHMIIARQIEKKKIKSFISENNIPENEKW